MVSQAAAALGVSGFQIRGPHIGLFAAIAAAAKLATANVNSEFLFTNLPFPLYFNRIIISQINPK